VRFWVAVGGVTLSAQVMVRLSDGWDHCGMVINESSVNRLRTAPGVSEYEVYVDSW
jgi:hypothetical protein